MPVVTEMESVMMPDSSKRGGVDAGMQGSGMQEGGAGGMWNVAGGGHDDQMSRVDSGGASQLWSGEGAGDGPGDFRELP